ncbi:MAG: hydroxymethylbilane synthase, partial [Lachnospiraceae bacterium]
MKTIRVGTRTSALAMKQAKMVMEKIERQNTDVSFEVIPKKTKGDKLLDTPLVEFGGKGAFITEFEEAMLD